MLEHTILDLSFDECAAHMGSAGEPRFRARQIFEWIYQKGVLDFDQMKNLSGDLRRKAKGEVPFPEFSLVHQQICSGQTKKLLFRLGDGQMIESIVIPAAKRLTVCVSSQAGCRFACRFCASGVGGWVRDLTCGEILMQVLKAESVEGRKVTHVVLMGTGEPFDNWPAVRKAIEIMNAPEAMNIAARRITISTCGIIPGIRELAGFGRQIELAVSLHGYDETTRGQLMPVNKRYPLRELIPACRDYIRQTKRQITFEYVMIDGLNCHEAAARALGKLLKGMLCKINLIPWNAVEEFSWSAPSRGRIHAFRDALIREGIHTTIRWSKGKDARGACGQLRCQSEKEVV